MASIKDFGIPGVIDTVLMPKRTNLYRVIFQGLGGATTDSKYVSAQTIRCDRPQVAIEKVATHRYNTTVSLGTRNTWQPVSMTVQDDIGGAASRALTAQLELQQQLIAATAGPYLAVAASASEYKFGVRLDTMDGGKNVLESWVLEGCWIESLNFGSHNYDDANLMNIEMSVSIDHAYHVIYGPENKSQTSAVGGAGSLQD